MENDGLVIKTEDSVTKTLMMSPDTTEVITSLLDEGISVWVTARGTSNYPIIKPGVTLLIEPLSYDDCVPGDMVVTRRGDWLVTHRLLTWKKLGRSDPFGLMITRGDSCLKRDKLSCEKEYVGVVKWTKQYGQTSSMQEGKHLLFRTLFTRFEPVPQWTCHIMLRFRNKLCKIITNKSKKST
jgi:hypothetical protein